MNTPPGLKPTGRSNYGPCGSVLEMIDETGKLYTGICFDSDHRGQPALRDAVSATSFLEDPKVEGLCPLVAHLPKRGLFVYRTGRVWLLPTVFDLARSHDRFPGTRAGLELMTIAVKILEDASFAGEAYDRYSHRSLSPWRVCLDARGQVSILGYGLPQLDILPEHQGKVDVASYRYAPPERIAGEPEDVTSDQFAMTLVGFELMFGEPLYNGGLEEVKRMAIRAVGRDRLYRFRNKLDYAVSDAMDRALDHHPDTRYTQPGEYHQRLHDLSNSPIATGPSLEEFMAWVDEVDPHAERLRRITDELEERAAEEDVEAPVARWEAPARRAREPSPSPRPSRESAPRKRSRNTRTERTPRKRPGRTVIDRNALYPHRPMSDRVERFQVREGGETHNVKLDLSQPLAESAARLVDILETSPVDLTGRMRGWFRIVQGDDCWYGDTLTEVLDPATPIELEFVENREVTCTLTIDGGDNFEATMGTAVHAQFLLGELRRLLDLDGSGWALYVDDRPLNLWQILDDYSPGEGFSLTLKRTRRRAG